MAENGFISFLELGYSDKNGKFISFNEPEIEMDICSYSFIRGIDDRGKIGTELRGGNFSFIISRLPPSILLEWAINSNKYFSGFIYIRDTHGNLKDQIFFENAACINLKMTYVNEGTAYFTLQAMLQAETIQLLGASPLINYWNNEKYRDSSHTKSEKETGKKEIKKVLNTEVSIKASMLLKNVNYELQSFELEFGQEVDYKGEPSNNVRGGFITVSLYSLLDANINKWLIGKDSNDGRLLFGDELVGYEMTIDFKGARCVGYLVEINTYSEDNITARLNIAPTSLSFGKDFTFKVPY